MRQQQLHHFCMTVLDCFSQRRFAIADNIDSRTRRQEEPYQTYTTKPSRDVQRSRPLAISHINIHSVCDEHLGKPDVATACSNVKRCAVMRPTSDIERGSPTDQQGTDLDSIVDSRLKEWREARKRVGVCALAQEEFGDTRLALNHSDAQCTAAPKVCDVCPLGMLREAGSDGTHVTPAYCIEESCFRNVREQESSNGSHPEYSNSEKPDTPPPDSALNVVQAETWYRQYQGPQEVCTITHREGLLRRMCDPARRRAAKQKRAHSYFFLSFRGRPRGRSDDSRPRCCAMRAVHRSSPQGLPRVTERRTAARSHRAVRCSFRGRLPLSAARIPRAKGTFYSFAAFRGSRLRGVYGPP